jgi:hypothetical protein
MSTNTGRNHLVRASRRDAHRPGRPGRRTRPSRLAGTIAWGMVIAVAGAVLAAGKPPVSAPATVSSPGPDFQVDPGWLKLPNKWVMGDPSSISVDRHDHVWVLHRPRTVPGPSKERAAPPVLEFDSSGTFIRGWGGPRDAYEWPDTEHGIYVDSRDHVWIGGNNPIAQVKLTTRSDDMLLEFDESGKVLMQIGHRDQSKGDADTKNVKEPADVFVYQPTNEVFVADGYGNRRVVVFDAGTGAFKRMWGAFANAPLDPPKAVPGAPAPRVTDGPGPPQFGTVHAVKVSNDGLVYVADRTNSRIQVFTLEGKYMTQVFVNRLAESSLTASGLAFSPDPEQRFLYVADFGNGALFVFNRKTLELVGRFGQRGSEPGDFQNLHHIATDSKGNLYTAEVSPGSRIQKFVFKGIATH